LILSKKVEGPEDSQLLLELGPDAYEPGEKRIFSTDGSIKPISSSCGVVLITFGLVPFAFPVEFLKFSRYGSFGVGS
jgi:hypothetical protein